jgi:hypothetical protein
MTTKTVTSVSTTVTVDLIYVITVTAGPISATTIGIAVTTATMTNVEMIGVMIDVARMTTTATTTTARGILHDHHLKGATLMVHFNQTTERLISSSVAAKRLKATHSSDQMQGRSGTSKMKLHNLCIGQCSQSLSLGMIIWCTYQTQGPTR